ncbi:apolipoprotein N-acyltransferase [Planctomicrobium sp. SH668]|uniref:apolipoprotein N-acyltransferase n=1 Tax=Planctomicrobium sp. SH668 TaxID=3448126 RepID=UPI003F5B6950
MEPVSKKLDQNDATPYSPELAERVAGIISRGKKSRPGAFSTFAFAISTAVLLWSSFTPLDWGPLAWIALVPLLCLVLPANRTRWMYRTVYLAGLIYWLATLQWMRLGDPTMYFALIALSAYLACYWSLFLWLCRLSVHRFHFPLLIAAPAFWVGIEYARAYIFTGFSWYYIAHTQYRWVDFIQISDLFGAYGISFVVVLANAALVQLIQPSFLVKWNLCWPGEQGSAANWSRVSKRNGIAVSLLAVMLVVCYGMARRNGESFPLGPRVALIQGNFVANVRNNTDDPRDIYMKHRNLTGVTVGDAPDFVVWPEGMFPYGLYETEQGVTDEQLDQVASDIPVRIWRDRDTQKALSDIAEMVDAALIIGASTFVADPAKYSIFNSAVFVQPGVGMTSRYDKNHRVPLGEYIPLRELMPFLQSLTPFRGRFGIDRGTEGATFKWRDWDLIPIICFEDTVPHLVRRLSNEAGVNQGDQNQVLVNLTNDGWFHGSSELNQHLITSQFRAIETRTPLVRAVNTGISAVIDGDGVVRDALKFYDASPRDDGLPLRDSMRDPKTGRLHKQLACAIVADVPLDPRTSWYVMTGDWFAAACLLAVIAAALLGIFRKQPPHVLEDKDVA